MSRSRILIVHPDPPSLALLCSMAQPLGHVITGVANDRAAVRHLELGGADMILAGADPADPDALEILTYVRRKHRHVPMILLIKKSDPGWVKEALRLGARTVLRDPIPAHELKAAVVQALETIPQDTSTHRGGGGPVSVPPTGGPVAIHPTKADRLTRRLRVVGNDPGFRRAVELAVTVAPARTPVLITGERGTGKSLLARTVHRLGSRSGPPFVVFDCVSQAGAALDHECAWDDWGFTPRCDTGFDWASKLREARGGTLFLKNVAALSDPIQPLGVLRSRESESGSQGEVRLLMSGSNDITALVEQGITCLRLPPLRHRGTDIEMLADFFRARFSWALGKNVAGFTPAAIDVLNNYGWPGNVRELKEVVRRAVAHCKGVQATPGDLSVALRPLCFSHPGAPAPRYDRPPKLRPLKEAMKEPEKRIIVQTLRALNWSRQEAARVLDINRTTLYKKMKIYNINQNFDSFLVELPVAGKLHQECPKSR